MSKQVEIIELDILQAPRCLVVVYPFVRISIPLVESSPTGFQQAHDKETFTEQWTSRIHVCIT